VLQYDTNLNSITLHFLFDSPLHMLLHFDLPVVLLFRNSTYRLNSIYTKKLILQLSLKASGWIVSICLDY